MLLNESTSFSEVRYVINSRISYDVEAAFVGFPQKVLLIAGTRMARLDFPVVFGIFTKAWWTPHGFMQKVLAETKAEAAALRLQWQHSQALPKASKGIRTFLVEIELTQPVYAWIGRARPLFNKPGGAEQIYLPNLAAGAGPNRSDYARLRRTYAVPVP
jgi:hypothetical protein